MNSKKERCNIFQTGFFVLCIVGGVFALILFVKPDSVAYHINKFKDSFSAQTIEVDGVSSDMYLENIRSNMFIAHAGGQIDGNLYTNSKEAIQESFDRGFNIVEVDIMPTSDGDYVLCHRLVNITSKSVDSVALSEFLEISIRSGYTLLTLESFLDFIKNQHMACVLHILNVNGYDEGKDFSGYLEKLVDKNYDANQIYILVSDRDTYRGVKDGSEITWKFIYWTGDIRKDLSFFEDEGIKVITVGSKVYEPEELKPFIDAGYFVYMYKCEDIEEAIRYRQAGVGIYSNFISPQIFYDCQ